MTSWKRQTLFTALSLSILGSGCASTEKDSEKTGLAPYFSGGSGLYEEFRKPWPRRKMVVRKEILNTELIGAREVLRLYDFTGDGRVDMIEKLDEKGQVILTAFDFDLDGKPDWVGSIKASPPSLKAKAASATDSGSL